MFDIQKEAINFGSAQEQTSERCIKTVDKRFRPLHFASATPERYCNKFMNQDYIFFPKWFTLPRRQHGKIEILDLQLEITSVSNNAKI